jgi:4-carboxymuconolactone decarboxylase
MLGAELTAGVTPVEAKEIVYQAVPYAGLGKVFDFLHATTPATRAEQGLAVQKQIMGDDRVEALYANAPDDEQHIQRLLSANCFGDRYTRTGIPPASCSPSPCSSR